MEAVPEMRSISKGPAKLKVFAGPRNQNHMDVILIKKMAK
jgi:hypothetical protein